MVSFTTSSSATTRSTESRAIQIVSAVGAVLAVLCVLSGVLVLITAMLGMRPWPILTQFTLVMFPIAFILLMATLVTAAKRRRQRR